MPPNMPTPAITTGRKTLTELCDHWSSRLRGRKEDGRAVTKSDLKKLEVQMAAVTITGGQGTKGSSAGIAPTGSISIGKVVLQEDEIEQFENSIKFATEVLESEKLGDLEDLEDARDTLVQLSEKKATLSAYKIKYPRLAHYQIVSFSKLTEKHLTDMGVTSVCLSEDHLDEILRIFDAFVPNVVIKESRTKNTETLSAIFEPFWEELTKDGRYINDFKILKRSIGRKPEARSRMLTDYILTQLMVFVNTHLDLIQFMFLELVLSTSSDPVPVNHGDTATLLTGSVDYAILSSVDARAAIARSLKVRLHDVEEKITKLSSGNNLDDIMGSEDWPLLQQFKHFKFTIIEEKRKDLGKKTLKDCKPQVLGESLALLSKIEQDYVLWCLSNGDEWIFGVLNDVKQSRSFPHMSIRDNDLEGSIKAILKMLILWTVCPVDDFHDLLGL